MQNYRLPRTCTSTRSYLVYCCSSIYFSFDMICCYSCTMSWLMCMYDAIMHKRERVHYRTYTRRTMVYLKLIYLICMYLDYLSSWLLEICLLCDKHRTSPHSDLVFCCPSVQFYLIRSAKNLAHHLLIFKQELRQVGHYTPVASKKM